MAVAGAQSSESSSRSSAGGRPPADIRAREAAAIGAAFGPSASGALTGARLAVGGAVCAALVLGGLSPVWAAEAPQGPPAVQLGSFAVGDGAEAMIDERDGSVSLSVSAGGVGVTWDSRAMGVNRAGLGEGWNIGVARVDRVGGVRVWPASGGVFEADASQPSGLSGYTGGDVVFRVVDEGAMVEARPDGVVAAQPYSYVLEELGGVRTYFNAQGDPIVKFERDARSDWAWADDGSSRLVRVVTADGVVTSLDWFDDAVEIRPGANVVSAEPGSGAGGVWRLELQDDRVSRVVDPSGAGTAVRYGDSGLISGIDAHSGASTEVVWQVGDDRVVRADTVRVLDVDGVELSRREWRSSASGTSSGWPAVGSGGLVSAGASYSTTLFDGATRIESTYDARHLMTERSVVAKTSAGEVLVQEQEFTFPTAGGDGLSARSAKPTGMTVTYHDASGASRAGTESYEFDDFGRMVRRQAADGTVTKRVFDAVLAEGAALPVGLPVSETTVAPDGLVAATVSELSADRRFVVGTETSTTKPGGLPVLTGRTEYTVEAGKVVEERKFPSGDRLAEPLVSTWDEEIDLAAGTRTIAQTVAAGTEAATTSTSVSSLVHGGALELTDAVGVRTSSTYDDAGREVVRTDDAGRSVSTEYGAVTADGVSSVTVLRGDGVAMTEEYDELGRVLRRIDNITPKGVAVAGYERVFETRSYPAPGVEEVTDAWGATTRTETDLFGRHTKTVLPTGLVQVSEYDDVAGTATTWKSPTGRIDDAESTTTERFDDRGRTVATTGDRADGVAVPGVTSAFDGLGRATATDDSVALTTVEYDDLGRPVQTTTTPVADAAAVEAETGADTDAVEAGAIEPADLNATRRFDGFGESVEKTLTSGEQSRSGGSRVLDVLGRTVLETDQEGVATWFEYEPDGLVRSSATDDGRTTKHTYDDATRALVKTEVSAPDRPTVVTEYSYDERGRLRGVFDPADEAGTRISYEYDDFGNTTSVQYPAEVEGEPGMRVRHEYDEHGRKLATVDVAGNRTDLSYDAAGQMTRTVQRDAAGELASAEYVYDDLARIVEVRRGNGVVTAIGYTSANQIASEVTTNGDVTQSERTYEYEAARGNLIARVDRTGEGDEAEATRTEYRYDTLDRLVSSIVRDGDTGEARVTSSTEYELMVDGSVSSETRTTDPGTERAVSTVRRFGYSPIGELTSIETTAPDGTVQVEEREYDPAGNLVRGADGTRFEWDAANRQISETRSDGTVIATEYWADGRRKALRTADASTTFYWDGTALLNDAHESVDESAADGIAGYLLGVQRQARTTRAADGSTDTAYYSTDRHGNVTELTDTSGAVTTEYGYSDYGVVTAPGEAVQAGVGDLARNAFQYASEWAHDDGTQFLRTRTLDPELMSFRNKDRAGLHNLFAYAEGNPIMRVDPSGRNWVMDYLPVILAGIGVLGALTGVVAAFATLAVATSKTMIGLGVAAVSFGIADAGFSGVEAWSIATNTKFMPDDVAIGVGAALGAIGVAFGIGGVLGGIAAARNGSKTVKATRTITFVEDEVDYSVAGQQAAYQALGMSPEEFHAVALQKVEAQLGPTGIPEVQKNTLILKKGLEKFREDHFLDANRVGHQELTSVIDSLDEVAKDLGDVHRLSSELVGENGPRHITPKHGRRINEYITTGDTTLKNAQENLVEVAVTLQEGHVRDELATLRGILTAIRTQYANIPKF